MSFKNFFYNKLVRDKTVERCYHEGSKVVWHSLNDADYLKALKLKLLEEAQEVIGTQSKEELAEELADVLEVVNALCALHALSLQELQVVQQKKFEDRGGFYDRIFIKSVEHPIGSNYEKYCSANPEKYPEIKQ